MRMWELWPTGRLHPFDGAFVACSPEVLQPRPALVKLAPGHWLRTEHSVVRQQELLPSAERRQLMEPWLVRVYDDMDLDPTVWERSFGQPQDTVSLMDMEVRHARHRFTHLNFLRRSASLASRLPGYAEHGAIWPAAWPLDTSTNAAPPIKCSRSASSSPSPSLTHQRPHLPFSSSLIILHP